MMKLITLHTLNLDGAKVSDKEDPTISELAAQIWVILNENFERLDAAVNAFLDKAFEEAGDVSISSVSSLNDVEFEYFNMDNYFNGKYDAKFSINRRDPFQEGQTLLNRKQAFDTRSYRRMPPAQGFIELIKAIEEASQSSETNMKED